MNCFQSVKEKKRIISKPEKRTRCSCWVIFILAIWELNGNFLADTLAHCQVYLSYSVGGNDLILRCSRRRRFLIRLQNKKKLSALPFLTMRESNTSGVNEHKYSQEDLIKIRRSCKWCCSCIVNRCIRDLISGLSFNPKDHLITRIQQCDNVIHTRTSDNVV